MTAAAGSLADWKTVYVVGSVLAAGVFLLVGQWGWRNAETLVPPTQSLPAKERKLRALRRGAVICHVLAVVIVGLALAAAIVQ